MSDTILKDVLINARQESYRMRHFHLGVEHLFIALLDVQDGLANQFFNSRNFTASYLTDIIRRKLGKGGRHRLWAGIPNTPRAEVVLTIANEIALEDHRQYVTERDLLLAILEEGDSVPARVLTHVGFELDQLRHDIAHFTPEPGGANSFVHVDISATIDLTQDELYLLRQLNTDSRHLEVKRTLQTGLNKGLVLIMHSDTTKHDTVIKIAHDEQIIDELAQNKDHISDQKGRKVVINQYADIAALEYDRLQTPFVTFLDFSLQADADHLQSWLTSRFMSAYNNQFESESYSDQLHLWQTLDWLLPPIFHIQAAQSPFSSPGVHVLRYPVKQQKLISIGLDDQVIVENFSVLKKDPSQHTLTVGLGTMQLNTRGYQVKVNGIDFTQEAYYRGEIVERIYGKVTKTRSQVFDAAFKALEPDFIVKNTRFHVNSHELSDPLQTYKSLYDLDLYAHIGQIHGNLHAENILISQTDDQNINFIDDALSRKGPVIFDWVALEVSLITLWLEQQPDDMSWSEVLTVASDFINQDNSAKSRIHLIIHALRPKIMSACLNLDKPIEYQTILAFLALNGLINTQLKRSTRRFMYLIASLTIDSVLNYHEM